MPGSISTSYDAKTREKEDMQRLNDKLALYVQKVRQLGGNGNNTPAFLASLAMVEDELRKLKALYETEIDDLRKQLGAANKAKHDSQSELEKLRRAAADLDDKYKAESAKNQGLLSDLQRHKEKIADLEQKLAVAKASMVGPSSQLAGTKRELEKTQAQNEAMADQLSQEKSRGKQLQDAVNDLQKKASFNDQVYKEKLTEAESRNERAKERIADLDKKNKALETQIATAPEMLSKMRAKSEAEIQKFKDESEAAFKKSMAELKSQMDAQAANMEQLRAVNRDLQAQNDDLRNKVAALEGNIRELKAQIAATDDQLKSERKRGTEQARALEKKLQDLQDGLFKKMQDLNASRELQVSLRAEIEAMRVLLEEEERRLGGLPSKTSGQGVSRGRDISPCNSRAGSSLGVSKNPTGIGADGAGGRTGQTGQGGLDTSAKYASPPYTMRSEYQYSYNKPGCFGRSNNFMRSGSNSNLRPLSTSADGFPTLDTTCRGGFTTGSTKNYMMRSPDIRNNGTYANANNGQIRKQGLPPVY